MWQARNYDGGGFVVEDRDKGGEAFGAADLDMSEVNSKNFEKLSQSHDSPLHMSPTMALVPSVASVVPHSNGIKMHEMAAKALKGVGRRQHGRRKDAFVPLR